MAQLEGADRAFAFTSGMAALSTVAHLVEAGENTRNTMLLSTRLWEIIMSSNKHVALHPRSGDCSW